METSSPLAAIHRPMVGFGQRNARHTGSQTVVSPGKPRGTGIFNRGQARSRHDYFGLQPVHGSSPTGSLAADLCQNFRIGEDLSPPIPTPRRALFTAAHLAASEESRIYVTTPPLPESSPMQFGESMDMDMDVEMSSPMLRKAPRVVQVEIQSPTPTESVDMMVDSPVTIEETYGSLKPAVDRPKAFSRRPSLTRAKGYTTGVLSGSARLFCENKLPNFRFGGAGGGDGGPGRLMPSSSSGSTLGETLLDSPCYDRRPQTANSPPSNAPVARPRQHFSSLSSATAVRNGSPIAGHARRPSNPFNRPRKQYRRTLSMFESGDMTRPKKEESQPACSLAAVIDTEEPHLLVLPHHFPEGSDDGLPRITRSTLLDVLDGKFNPHFDNKLVIDCRFEYEYEGGHVDGAVHYNDKELLATHLFRHPMEGRSLLVFHCEYSAHRAPMMARHVRSEDRTANAEHYPKLTYPEVYILEGGYSGFWAEHPGRCYPQAYVEMDDKAHTSTCEREMGKLRQNRKGLHRAQTFAFGQHEYSANDSPGASSVGGCHDSPVRYAGASPILGSDRYGAKRTASY